MTPTILVTSASNKVQLVKSLTHYGNVYGVKVITSDISVDAAALYFSHDHILLPKLNSPEYISTLTKLCQKKSIRYILPTRDGDLEFFTKHYTLFLDKNIVLLMSPPKTIEICTNKHLFRKFCDDNNLPIPGKITDISRSFRPCVAKLAKSSASAGVFIVQSKKDLDILLSRCSASELTFEELISAKEYSIDAFHDNNGNLVGSVTRERIKVVNGESSISQVVDAPLLSELARNLSKLIPFRGHITIQAFMDANSIYLIEVNPRFGGASNLSIQAGLASTERLMASIVGDTETLYRENELKIGLKMLRYSEDLFLNA
ncbi:ATP-grasp domain-containing protein [Agarivorans litoreus]|uniref:ATP-grasp domain-containing protein n=1 Tax=Agarivorans litoreus TaxID=1510455 RepID=UPI001C7DD077|nr:ATP-grasp domain-containing protein [Agarivorans litoreus]